jgi:hypothetical protein
MVPGMRYSYRRLDFRIRNGKKYNKVLEKVKPKNHIKWKCFLLEAPDPLSALGDLTHHLDSLNHLNYK